MKNFFLRLISSLVIAPLFLYALHERGYLFYSILLLILIFSFYEIFKNVKQIKLCFFLYSLIIFFIFSLINVRGDNFHNFIFCLWILFIVWSSDISGYIVGKIFKGPKLSSYSPNKTISGFVGSIIFSQLSVLVLFKFINNFSINIKIIAIQFIICLVAIFGDIFFSYVKRINNLKDYSNIIPGHGGVLDRIDGMIFAMIFYNFFIFSHVI